MFRPETPRSRFGKPNFILVGIVSVDREISIIDLLGADCRKLREKESKQNRTNPVHMRLRLRQLYAVETPVGCNLALIHSRSAIARITEASTTATGQKCPANLAEIASLEGFNLLY